MFEMVAVEKSVLFWRPKYTVYIDSSVGLYLLNKTGWRSPLLSSTVDSLIKTMEWALVKIAVVVINVPVLCAIGTLTRPAVKKEVAVCVWFNTSHL